mmetsp:Transcript_83793/g.269962  ORF Transcript_83793/g.269962 Transcript_83793/m.269962 type:complete len:98 (-) Transcript_83793:2386-2679(-)
MSGHQFQALANYTCKADECKASLQAHDRVLAKRQRASGLMKWYDRDHLRESQNHFVTRALKMTCLLLPGNALGGGSEGRPPPVKRPHTTPPTIISDE